MLDARACSMAGRAAAGTVAPRAVRTTTCRVTLASSVAVAVGSPPVSDVATATMVEYASRAASVAAGVAGGRGVARFLDPSVEPDDLGLCPGQDVPGAG